MFRSSILIAAVAGLVVAQRPSDTPICDYYTTALLKDNTAENQATILTLLVNTVVAGNYTKPTIEGVTFPDVMVPGILAKGDVDGESVDLLPYFDGTLASSNRGGDAGVSVNFLDDGGAEPLFENKPAAGTDSNQYKLLTHLYQFFGTLLGCTEQGMQGFDSYSGVESMYEAHKFMVLNEAQVTYFITQVGLAASSFGVAEEDVQAVGKSLNTIFGYKCSPPTEVIKEQGPQLQSICTDEECPEDEMAADDCPAALAAPSESDMSGGASPSGTMSGDGAMPSETDAASRVVASFGLLSLGLFGFFL